ncbi:hypothetical protein KR093_000518, partial [Drosophila rubida]
QVETSKQLPVSPNLEMIKNDLLLGLNSAFPRNKIDMKLFGSRLIGVGNDNSDLDVFVNVGKITIKLILSRNMLMTIYFQTAEVFYGIFNESWASVVTLINAKVPVICLIHNATKIKVDINFTDKLSSTHDIVINYLFDLQPIARFMVHYLRHRTRSLQLQHYFRSHYHTLMIFYFLQIKNLLPPVVKLQRNINQDFGPIIGEYKYPSLRTLGLERIEVNSNNTQNMLKEYFQFYSNFNYDKYAISSYYGTWITRAKLAHLMPKA